MIAPPNLSNIILPPVNKITAYLQANGWKISLYEESKTTVWTHTLDEEDLEVILPLKENLRGYERRIAELLSALSVLEERPYTEILTDIHNSLSDIIKVRLDSYLTRQGTIPIKESTKFSRSVKHLIESAASAVNDSRPYFAQVSSEVSKYLDKVHIGHEKGSYVAVIFSPTDQNRQLTIPNINSDSFGRKAVKKLATTISLICEISEEVLKNDDIDVFVSGVEHGISANMCDAIVDLDDSGHQNGLEILVNLSSTEQAQDLIPRKISLPHKYMPVLKAAARRLKSLSYQDVQLRGKVTSLSRPTDSSVGKVVLQSTFEGKKRDIRICLEDPWYGQAVNAHQSRLTVSCQGHLVIEKQSFSLESVKKFEILDDR